MMVLWKQKRVIGQSARTNGIMGAKTQSFMFALVMCKLLRPLIFLSWRWMAVQSWKVGFVFIHSSSLDNFLSLCQISFLIFLNNFQIMFNIFPTIVSEIVTWIEYFFFLIWEKRFASDAICRQTGGLCDARDRFVSRPFGRKGIAHKIYRPLSRRTNRRFSSTKIIFLKTVLSRPLYRLIFSILF